ncbi:hypothetical protein DAPPUDRAFT_51858, partial [Daphnia pulex]
KGDVRDIDSLLEATQNVTCVIHTASYGMSGREQMPPYFDKVEEVNIVGTRNVIKACAKNNCKGLVYTSTYNVVFGGDAILNGDESLPYFPLHRHVDHYSRTKSIAEQLVLTSNGRGDLQTCALRLAGVIGRGESRHLPRVLDAIRKGLVRFNYYDEHGGKVDFIGLDNVVQGHVKAALKLVDTNRNIPGIGGQAFFLSDGCPVNNLEYFKPLMEHYGQPFPTTRIPMWLMYILVFFVHFVYSAIYRFIDFTPFLTPAELFKTGVTHYFSIAKARKQLDYHPVRPNDLSGIITDLREPHRSS